MTNAASRTNRKNAPTTRVSKLVANGAYMEIGEYIVAVHEIEADYDEQPGYGITTHKGEMPAHHSERFDTIQELANAMRNEADLRTWRYAEQW